MNTSDSLMSRVELGMKCNAFHQNPSNTERKQIGCQTDRDGNGKCETAESADNRVFQTQLGKIRVCEFALCGITVRYECAATTCGMPCAPMPVQERPRDHFSFF